MAEKPSNGDALSPIGSSHSGEMAKRALASEAYREALRELAPAENLARLIIHKRTELGLSQADLADRMGTTPSVISRLENGQHSITMKTLQRVAAALERHLVVGFAEDEELEVATSSASTPELAAV
jgi:ribosome-binding protein aMBF1 (putative translation factor)